MNRNFTGVRLLKISLSVFILIAAAILCFGLVRGLLSPTEDGTSGDAAADLIFGSGGKVAAAQKVSYDRVSYELKPYAEGQVLFENQRDGYRLVLPKTITQTLDCSEICASFEDDKMTLEIYREQFEDYGQIESFVGYSDKFLENQNDHTMERDEVTTINGITVYITQWSREKLKNIEKDKNHYACVDLLIGNNGVCTLFFKSTEPFEDENQYMKIVETLEFKKNAAEEAAIDAAASFVSTFVGVLGVTNEANMTSGAVAATDLQVPGVRDYWSLETKQAYLKYFGPCSPLTWGIFEYGAPEDFQELKGLEKQLDFTFDILLNYNNFDKTGVQKEFAESLRNAKKENRILEISLQTAHQEDGNMVYDILNGELDNYLSEFAAIIRDTGQPVLFRLCNEMNGDWCEYSSFHTSRDTAIFKAMYQYVFHKFEEAGALPYTIWVWNPNEKSFPSYKWNHEYMYYPGDEFVDVIGITGYNTGTYYEGEHWRSFDEIYGPLYEEVTRNYEQPLMITEFACSSVGGDKVKWMEDMFQQIKKYDRIKAAVWWNGRDMDSKGNVARPYWLNENDNTLSVFKKHMLDFK